MGDGALLMGIVLAFLFLVLIGSGDEPAAGDAPCSPYAATKWAVGGYARMFLSLYGTPVTTARPFMVYGPDQPDVSKVVPYSNGRPIVSARPIVSTSPLATRFASTPSALTPRKASICPRVTGWR